MAHETSLSLRGGENADGGYSGGYSGAYCLSQRAYLSLIEAWRLMHRGVIMLRISVVASMEAVIHRCTGIHACNVFRSKNVEPACRSKPASTLAGYRKSMRRSNQTRELMTSIELSFCTARNSCRCWRSLELLTIFCMPTAVAY